MNLVFTHKAVLNGKEIYTDFHRYAYVDKPNDTFHLDMGELWNMSGEVKLDKSYEVLEGL